MASSTDASVSDVHMTSDQPTPFEAAQRKKVGPTLTTEPDPSTVLLRLTCSSKS
jgi:hypothetical protein